MVSPIPKAVQKLWEEWNIRGVILLSLFLQTYLVLLSPSRKRTVLGIVRWSIWLAYLLADWAANFCVGLISNNSKNDDDNSATAVSNNNLRAFWVPFLLLHLGGPDNITAFALEDNELWLRHLLGLVFQALAAAYVFLLTLPHNPLWIPTLLVFLAGLIKYAERTRSLQLASLNIFRKSMIPDPDPGPNYAKLLEELNSKVEAGIPAQIMIRPAILTPGVSLGNTAQRSYESSYGYEEARVLKDAYDFVNEYKGLIVDRFFSFSEHNLWRQLFIRKGPEEALLTIEVELNYIYEIFFTKVSVVRHKVGYFFRFVSFCSIVIALGLFTRSEKNHGFDKFDVEVTYVLLYGAVALDTMGLLLLIFSDRTIVDSQSSHFFKDFKDLVLKLYISFREPKWSRCKKKPYTNYLELSTLFIFRRWSGKISGHNLMTYCLRQCSSKKPNLFCSILECAFDYVVNYFGAREYLEVWKYKKNNPFLKELWEFILTELKRKSKYATDLETMQWICSTRGEMVLQEVELEKDLRQRLMPFVDTNAVTFDESLIMWHIATQLCDASDDEDENNYCREFSKLLSDYMLYLLVMQPTIMSTVAGIGLIRFRDTCAEAIKFFSKRNLVEEQTLIACKNLLSVPTDIKPTILKGDASKSLLFDASYNCRPIDYVQQLSKGGELISIVWLLMVHLGLGTQFQNISHGSVMLVVDK
ncbi:uncharacterized protein G2W53_001527 [Senna tora]|uniref:DUF4220 domain-containing protein n=1 Tax=Senna tora TaxID=362788 RepID=A0A835CMM9_9FABA|nr:uncharacterized protein G2W53_001527 [Senna tora]